MTEINKVNNMPKLRPNFVIKPVSSTRPSSLTEPPSNCSVTNV